MPLAICRTEPVEGHFICVYEYLHSSILSSVNLRAAGGIVEQRVGLGWIVTARPWLSTNVVDYRFFKILDEDE